jgi:hypothetical protein
MKLEQECVVLLCFTKVFVHKLYDSYMFDCMHLITLRVAIIANFTPAGVKIYE